MCPMQFWVQSLSLSSKGRSLVCSHATLLFRFVRLLVGVGVGSISSSDLESGFGTFVPDFVRFFLVFGLSLFQICAFYV